MGLEHLKFCLNINIEAVNYCLHCMALFDYLYCCLRASKQYFDPNKLQYGVCTKRFLTLDKFLHPPGLI